LIADVVGIGKTYVGTALLKYLQRDHRPLIISPPHLREMWERFCAKYEIDANFLSDGKLSQEKYSLYQDYKLTDRDLVLIDESHHFRNHDTRRYENLKHYMIARDAKAILLTATPFSNKPEDLKNQIMLFHTSDQTSIPPANVTGLNKFFKNVKDEGADQTDLLKNIIYHFNSDN
jgi:superfamily II DNA or RNA helicase